MDKEKPDLETPRDPMKDPRIGNWGTGGQQQRADAAKEPEKKKVKAKERRSETGKF